MLPTPPSAPTCATCGHPLRSWCPACRGKRGGMVRSRKKTRAVRLNGQKAARRPKPGGV